ncbi:SGNH/GDSL hydrolase family protein [Clostridium sp. CF012]|uniref:SGNH/GDSL hydrolase family protein n=1 Tax=Clostridium sp. CF012 TaxID=2843319 RepID=UPI001C0BDBE1|nr:SGNH/GDSL hydrolase family protein [Clostridium sp. CF012]MBU3142897.1 hypothetical protein [Clostridium sp. CF012]
MIYDSMEFFNIVEVKKNSLDSGVRLYRYPKKLSDSIKAKERAERCQGCEIRFVTESDIITLSLSVDDVDGDILVYRGDYFYSIFHLKAGIKTMITLSEPERFSCVKKGSIKRKRFSPEVWRVFLNTSCTSFYGIDTFGKELRPPKPEELPSKRWLAYGSSITWGSKAIHNCNSYIQQAALRLNVDVYNLGLSGRCYCEKEVADYIAGRNDWDFVTLEIGVNMRSVFSGEEFQQKAEYMIEKILESHPDNPVVIISIFPNHSVYAINDNIYKKNDAAYCKILKELSENKYKNKKNVFFISGEEILDEFTGLTCDLIHPSDSGHIRMGENLANILKDLLKLKS